MFRTGSISTFVLDQPAALPAPPIVERLMPLAWCLSRVDADSSRCSRCGLLSCILICFLRSHLEPPPDITNPSTAVSVPFCALLGQTFTETPEIPFVRFSTPMHPNSSATACFCPLRSSALCRKIQRRSASTRARECATALTSESLERSHSFHMCLHPLLLAGTRLAADGIAYRAR
jgi:hypothetical protein